MDRPVKRRVWRRILMSTLVVGLIVVIGLVVWLSTGGWSEVKLSRQVMRFRADPAMDVTWTSEEQSAARQKQLEDRRTELFASLEVVGQDRTSFRRAYRDIIIIAAPELNRMTLFTPAIYYFGSDPVNRQRATFFLQLADILRKYPKVCLPIVMGLLDHTDPDVQAVAVGCVWCHPVSPGKVPPKAPDQHDCTEYLRAVEERLTEFVAKLIPMLRHPRSEVRVMTAEVLGRGFGQLHPKAALELATIFRDERHPPLYFAMSRSLKQIPRWWESAEGRQAVPVIAEAMADPDKRRTAVDHLVPAGPEAREAIPYAVQALQKADDQGRMEVLRLLLATSPDAKATTAAVPQLIELLRRKSDGFRTDTQVGQEHQCRMEALKVLKALGPEAKAAESAVKELTENKDYLLKTAAADTLKAIAP